MNPKWYPAYYPDPQQWSAWMPDLMDHWLSTAMVRTPPAQPPEGWTAPSSYALFGEELKGARPKTLEEQLAALPTLLPDVSKPAPPKPNAGLFWGGLEPIPSPPEPWRDTSASAPPKPSPPLFPRWPDYVMTTAGVPAKIAGWPWDVPGDVPAVPVMPLQSPPAAQPQAMPSAPPVPYTESREYLGAGAKPNVEPLWGPYLAPVPRPPDWGDVPMEPTTSEADTFARPSPLAWGGPPEQESSDDRPGDAGQPPLIARHEDDNARIDRWWKDAIARRQQIEVEKTEKANNVGAVYSPTQRDLNGLPPIPPPVPYPWHSAPITSELPFQRAIAGAILDATIAPLVDAYRAAKGQMTEQEQKDFALLAALGFVGPRFGHGPLHAPPGGGGGGAGRRMGSGAADRGVAREGAASPDLSKQEALQNAGPVVEKSADPRSVAAASGRLRNPATGRYVPDPANPPSPYVFTDAQRRAEWKRLAQDPNSDLTDAQRARIQARGWRGLQRESLDTGEMETMELSHEPIPLREGGSRVVPRWPAEHALVDPHRRLKKR